MILIFSDSSVIKPTLEEAMADSLKHPDYFGVSKLFTMTDLFNNRIHFGHRNGTLNTFMKPYIFGSRLDHLIIDLDQTTELLREALNFAAHISFRKGIILFACRTPEHQVS